MRGGEGGWRGGARDKRKGVNTRGMVHIFRIPRADETAKVLRQNDTRASRGGGKKKLERNMQNKLGRERKAARGVAKRGRGGEGERGS